MIKLPNSKVIITVAQTDGRSFPIKKIMREGPDRDKPKQGTSLANAARWL